MYSRMVYLYNSAYKPLDSPLSFDHGFCRCASRLANEATPSLEVVAGAQRSWDESTGDLPA